LGERDPLTVQSKNNLGYLYLQLARLDEAEHLLRPALDFRQKHFGTRHPATAESMGSMAKLNELKGFFNESDALYRMAILIKEETLGRDDSNTIFTRSNYANLLRRLGRDSEAQELDDLNS
jgi:tetratricopeptide (TPR) repeat protein